MGTQKIIQEILDNLPAIINQHRQIYRDQASTVLSRSFRALKHDALRIGSVLALRIAKNRISQHDKTGVITELTQAALARRSSSAQPATDERLHLYAEALENYRLAAWHLQSVFDIDQFHRDIGIESVELHNPTALVEGARHL